MLKICSGCAFREVRQGLVDQALCKECSKNSSDGSTFSLHGSQRLQRLGQRWMWWQRPPMCRSGKVGSDGITFSSGSRKRRGFGSSDGRGRGSCGGRAGVPSSVDTAPWLARRAVEPSLVGGGTTSWSRWGGRWVIGWAWNIAGNGCTALFQQHAMSEERGCHVQCGGGVIQGTKI